MDKDMFHSLEGKYTYFKSVTIDDTDAMHVFTSDKETKKYIGWKLMNTIDETRAHVEELIRREEAGTHLYASIVVKSTETVIGTAMLFNFDKESNHAEIGYVLNKEYWNKGYGSECVELVSGFAFESLKLHKIHASVVSANFGSARILEKNGYELEGRLKDHFFVDGNYHDDLLFGKFEVKE